MLLNEFKQALKEHWTKLSSQEQADVMEVIARFEALAADAASGHDVTERMAFLMAAIANWETVFYMGAVKLFWETVVKRGTQFAAGFATAMLV